MKSGSMLLEIGEILKRISIKSSTAYTFQNQIINTGYKPEEIEEKEKLHKYFIHQFANLFYTIYHCRQTGNSPVLNSYSLYEKTDFIELLSIANMGHGFWDDGWEIAKIEKNGYLVVLKNDLNLSLLPQQFRTEDGNIDVGKKGKILMPKEFRSLYPSFYMANGNEPLINNSSIVRIYWNIASRGAALLMKYITTELNDKNIPFQFKIINSANNFTRSDAGVLYMNQKDLEESVYILTSIYKKVLSFLKDPTPLFAKRLASGLSLAEDPHNGESFGQHRSRILAESLYRIFEKNLLSNKEKLDEVERYFTESQIDINHPYLSFSPRDYYDTIFKGAFI